MPQQTQDGRRDGRTRRPLHVTQIETGDDSGPDLGSQRFLGTLGRLYHQGLINSHMMDYETPVPDLLSVYTRYKSQRVRSANGRRITNRILTDNEAR